MTEKMNIYNFIVEVTIEGYSAYCEPSDGGIIATTGYTIAELQANVLDAVNLTLTYQNKECVDARNINLVYG